MSKWRVVRIPKATPRLMTIVLGAAMGIATALALPYARGGDPDCSLLQARLETSEYPAFELRFCVTFPSTGSAVVVRYDIGIHIAIVPLRSR